MNSHSGKSLPFPMPHLYALGTTTARPSRFAPPTHDHDHPLPGPEVQPVASQSCPRVLSDSYQCHLRSQYLSFTPPRSRDPTSYSESPGRSASRSRHTQDTSNMDYLLPRGTPTTLSEDPFSNPKKTNPHKIELRPELTTKNFDDLGLPHVDLRYQLPGSVAILGDHRFDLKQPSVTSVRIISQAFPWNIDITKSRKHGNITWKDMLEGLHNGLHKQIEDHEWPLLMLDRDPQYKVDIETIANTRINDPDRTPRHNLSMKPGDKGPSKTNDWSMKRIDWLGDRTAFLGFRQDRDLEEMRRMPNSKLPMSEVWVAELGTSGRRGGRRS